MSWTLAVARDDLTHTTLTEKAVPSPSDGEAVLRVDRVGLTANNVTYAVLGESFRYWEHFPAGDPALGIVPLWGFAEVVASTVPGVEIGQRHRAELPSPYLAYALTTGDPAYEVEREDLLILFRPLFFTSFMLADQLRDNDFYGARTLVLSSASSKTAYAAAFELHGTGPRVVGLTSPGNVAFTEELGCYDEVLPYDRVDALDASVPTAYLDLSGQPGVRAVLRGHLGAGLVRDIAVGLTAQVPNAMAAGEVFFAPVQMRKRTVDWGRDGLDARFGEAWRRFCGRVDAWVDISVSQGPEGLRAAWLDVLAGRTPPRNGLVIDLS
jgi:hypothetical protein